MRKKKPPSGGDTLEPVLGEIERLIKAEYGTFEKFCYGTGVISKSSLSRLLTDRKDCKVSSLKAIADGLEMDLVIRLKKRSRD